MKQSNADLIASLKAKGRELRKQVAGVKSDEVKQQLREIDDELFALRNPGKERAVK